MKFDFCIGNPPYHYETGRRKIPIYQDFIMSCTGTNPISDVVERLISELADKQGVGEALKAQSQMQWVMAMNNIKLTAEEIVRHDLLCPVG